MKFEPTAARLERGRYIVEGPAHCFQCHSEVNWEKPGAQPKPEKKGTGTPFIEDGMDWLVAPNITPDVETGAGSWTDEQFARAIREGIGHDGRRLFPMMPYMNFRQMSDENICVRNRLHSVDQSGAEPGSENGDSGSSQRQFAAASAAHWRVLLVRICRIRLSVGNIS